MPDITKLKVSLTKHGAHKIATLLRNYPAIDILNHVNDKITDVHIDEAQTRTILSAKNNNIPKFWTEVQSLGNNAINALVFLAIVFSHHKLISAMKKGKGQKLLGKIVRGDILDGKEFTNFSCILEELGYMSDKTSDGVLYDLSPIFNIYGLNSLVKQLLELKLESIGWDKKDSLVDQLILLRFHDVLAIDENGFRDWINDANDYVVDLQLTSDDLLFLSNSSDIIDIRDYHFTPLYNEKKETEVSVSLRKTEYKVNLIHNKMQNKLVAILRGTFGDQSVGGEVETGYGTYIDTVVEHNNECYFYEIKTVENVRSCIRQAIPQLLEYAYWPNHERATKLIIIGSGTIDEGSELFLNKLRTKFNIPLYYQQLDMENMRLIPNCQELINI